ncbi:protein binding protein [Hordeum vulgare]|nr:protein binding protein [Hordeum vulgare]
MGIGICAHLPAVIGDRDDCASERRAFDAFSQDSAALAAAAAHASAPNTPASYVLFRSIYFREVPSVYLSLCRP